MVLGNNGEVHQILITVIEHGVRMPHRAIMHITRNKGFNLTIVTEMPPATDDVDYFAVLVMRMITTRSTRLQPTHHYLVLSVHVIAGVKFTVPAFEIHYCLFRNLVEINYHI